MTRALSGALSTLQPGANQRMSDIIRIETNQRMSRAVKAAGLVFIGGETSNDHAPDVKVHTPSVLAKIDGFLEKAGTDKTRPVSAHAWLGNIEPDFAAMNRVWDASGAPGRPP